MLKSLIQSGHDYDLKKYHSILPAPPTSPPSYLARYYEQKFIKDAGGNSFYIWIAPCGLMILGTDMLFGNPDVVMDSIEYSNAVLNSKASGKRKRGALLVKKGSHFAKINYRLKTNEASCSISLISPITADLIAHNNQLLNNPSLLTSDGYTKGYLIILRARKTTLSEINEMVEK